MDTLRNIWEGYRLYLILGVVAVVVGFAIVNSRSVSQPLGIATATSPAPDAEIVVDVEGAVASPGLHELPANSLVEDAIVAAGGFTEAADLPRVAKELNRADRVKPNQKLYIPVAGEASEAAASGDVVNLNSATAAELDALPGIGPATAAKIIDYRESNGPFATIEELQEVPGIGASKFAELRDRVTV